MTLVDFDKVLPVLQVITVRAVFLCIKIGGFFYIYVLKNPPNELLLCSVHCTVYTETPYHECTRSHQLRTMTLRCHINSVPWMNAVTPTPYHECTQFADSVKSLSFSLTRGSFGPIAYIHGTELVWLRSFMVRSWWDLVKWPYGVQKSALSDFGLSKWL